MVAVGRINLEHSVHGDPRAKAAAEAFGHLLRRAGAVKTVNRLDSYTAKSGQKLELNQLAQALTNKRIEKSQVQKDSASGAAETRDDFDWAIEIKYKPGVTDNVGSTARSLAERIFRTRFDILNGENVYSSKVFLIKGHDLQREEIEKIAATLHNPQIETVEIKTKDEYNSNGGMEIKVPEVKLPDAQIKVDVPLTEADDPELLRIGTQGVSSNGSTGDSDEARETRRGTLGIKNIKRMRLIQDHFKSLGRNPTDVELESIAQTWSEHCKHTIFASPIKFQKPGGGTEEIQDGIYKHFIKKATNEILDKPGKEKLGVSVFTDNAGAIEFDDNYLLCDKAETHNSPSALDPYGGAITGIVGVNRDILGFGMGAKPVANAYGFCFGRPEDERILYRGVDSSAKPVKPMLSTRRIMEGVIEGVKDGGNQSGIPTNLGFMLFDDRYRGKPLVFVRTLGMIPKKVNGKPSHLKKAQAGDLVVVIGGRVGSDGIHGATFSSEALSENSPATAVQIGDAFTQKKLSDALIKEARDQDLYHSITDNGAGGLSCSVAEMAKEAGKDGKYGGFEVDLAKVPLKYPKLEPWKIWVSESQERMTLSVPPNKWEAFEKIMKKHGVEASVIGKFTDSGQAVVKHGDTEVMDMSMDFLHDGWETGEALETEIPEEAKQAVEEVFHEDRHIGRSILDMLNRLNITSNQFVSQQYDHEVQGGSVIKPLQGKGQVNGDIGVFKPELNSPKAVIMSQGITPQYSDYDTYNMAAASIDTAIRNAVAGGADPDKIALMDNFCWYKGDQPESVWKLVQASRACYDYATKYGTPFISGKDSMFNDFSGFDDRGVKTEFSIPPTLLISSVSVMDDATKAVSMDSKAPGDLVYVLGDTNDEIGGSEYAKYRDEERARAITGKVPEVDASKNLKLYRAVHKAIQHELLASSLAIGRGGLATALMKMSIAGQNGLDINLKNLSGDYSRDEQALFSESQGRILVTVAPENQKRFELLMKATTGKQPENIGQVGEAGEEAEIKINNKAGNELVKVGLEEASNQYKERFKDY